MASIVSVIWIITKEGTTEELFLFLLNLIPFLIVLIVLYLVSLFLQNKVKCRPVYTVVQKDQFVKITELALLDLIPLQSYPFLAKLQIQPMPDASPRQMMTIHSSLKMCIRDRLHTVDKLNAIQCMGFAYKLAYDAYGSSARTWTQQYNLNNLKPGDIIRYDTHSIFVTAVNGDTIIYGDANGQNSSCIIRWNRSTTKSAILNRGLVYVKIAPWNLLQNSSTVTAVSYTHLDVYKRQLQQSFMCRVPQFPFR